MAARASGPATRSTAPGAPWGAIAARTPSPSASGVGAGGGSGSPLYVTATDIAANTVTVGPREALRRTVVGLEEIRLHRPAGEIDAAKLRYRATPVAAALDGDVLTLGEPVWGAAPGQTAVLLRGDVVVGCATIAP